MKMLGGEWVWKFEASVFIGATLLTHALFRAAPLWATFLSGGAATALFGWRLKK